MKLGLVLLLGFAFVAAGEGRAQIRLGKWDIEVQPSVQFAYDSNVDDSYPEEESETLRKDDFYWVPGITLSAAGTRLRPDTTLGLSGTLQYEDYFRRNDLDTETYNAALTFQTMRPWSQLNGGVSAEYAIDSEEDTYHPGGAVRDPALTLEGTLGWQLKWNRLQFDLQGVYTRERHDYEEYQADDQDELDISGTLTLNLWTWLNAFASYEWDDVDYRLETGEDERTKTTTIGFSGSFFKNPLLTYTAGYEKEETGKGDDDDGKWKPTYSLAASVTKDITKFLQFSGSVTWDDDVDEDEVGTTFSASLRHVISAYLEHQVSASLEPRDTFGSNGDTETYEYAYSLNMKDFPIKGAHAGFSATYKEDRPLDDPDALTEDTTTLEFTAGHGRNLTRRLTRDLSYTYSWENSNFHHDGAKEKHEVLYTLQYRF